jgi:hypothetical protein
MGPMDFVAAEFDRIAVAHDTAATGAVEDTSIAAWAVSQVARGTVDVRERMVTMGDNVGQESLTVRAGLTLDLFANPACASVLNGELGGPIVADLVLVGIDGDAEARGFHTGTFSWGRDGRLTGTIAGITNAGTHHPPLYDAVAFDQRGQLVGRLEGRFEHDVLGRCVLYASYVLDLSDPDAELADVTGIIEGVVLVSDAAVTPPG